MLLSLLLSQPEADPRSTVLVRNTCETADSRLETTLFANGTIRVRRGKEGADEMRLAELGPAELEGYVERLAAENLDETSRRSSGLDGMQVERCRLELGREDGEREIFEYTGLSSHSLALSRVLVLVGELTARVSFSPQARSLPREYRPVSGDRLRRRDGYLYEVRGLTSDGRAVELMGIDQPFTIYVALDDFHREFVAIEPEPQR